MGGQQKKDYEVERKERVTLSIPYPSRRWSLAPVAHVRSRQDRGFAVPMRSALLDSITTSGLGSLRAVQTNSKRRHLRAHSERRANKKTSEHGQVSLKKRPVPLF